MSAESTIAPMPLPRRAGAYTFAILFSLESFTRSLNSTVVSLQAYDILGASQKVSVLSTSVSLLVLMTTLMLPLLLGRLRRRWAYTLAACLMSCAALALATHTLPGQWIGAYLRNSSAAMFNIVLQLYILDNIRRHELARAEPIRLSVSTLSWTIGPALGVWLYVGFGPWGPQLGVIAAVALLMAVFWTLRLSDHGQILPSGRAHSFSPLSNVKRFIAQPRLRLAWTIAFGRSCFWTTFFIYGPLLMVEGGIPKSVTGLVISASQALLFTAYISGWIARRKGLRTVIAGAFVIAALASIAAGLAGTHLPWLAVGLLLVGTVASSAIDGVGAIPFMRAVKPHERQRMTAVYRTFIDFSELIPSFIFAFALMWLPIGATFVILGIWLLICSVISWRYLPRGL
ncbi:MFS transporter [Aestuariivirga sp.]|uniref:MFS transporter n=1 Tax=Aestuariivirga sp. TaxID=2650926 RepID=UPI0039E3034D